MPQLSTALADAYLDYFNNYLTVERYAEHNGLDTEDAKKLLNMGKNYHEFRVLMAKFA